MNKLVINSILVIGVLTFLGFGANVPQASAGFCTNPSDYNGRWVNRSSQPNLVKQAEISIYCSTGGPVGIGIDPNTGERVSTSFEEGHHPMFRIVARCGSGTCDWGWSPGQETDADWDFTDIRFWKDSARSRQFYTLQPNGQLKIRTIMSKGGKSHTFVDYLDFESNSISNFSNIKVPVYARLQVLSATGDGCGSNDWRPKISFARGANKTTSGWESWVEVPLKEGSVDIVFQLKEKDGGFCFKDDHFDINPDKHAKNLHYRIYLESKYVDTLVDGNAVDRQAAIGFINEGKHGEDRARVKVDIVSLYAPPTLILPSKPVSPQTNTESTSEESKTPSKQQTTSTSTTEFSTTHGQRLVLKHTNRCLNSTEYVGLMGGCEEAQIWKLLSGSTSRTYAIALDNGQKCLERIAGNQLRLKPCDTNNASQQFVIEQANNGRGALIKAQSGGYLGIGGYGGARAHIVTDATVWVLPMP